MTRLQAPIVLLLLAALSGCSQGTPHEPAPAHDAPGGAARAQPAPVSSDVAQVARNEAVLEPSPASPAAGPTEPPLTHLPVFAIPTRNGDPAHPLALHPKWADPDPDKAAAWVESLARAVAQRIDRVEIVLVLPAGSPRGQRMSANQLHTIPPPLQASLARTMAAVKRDHPGVRFGAYVGWAIDETPLDADMPRWRFAEDTPEDRAAIAAQYRDARRIGFDTLWLDAISGQHRHGGDALAWMDRVAEESGAMIGGEAFLMDADGANRYDLSRDRRFMAFWGPWILRNRWQGEQGQPWYAGLNGHTDGWDAEALPILEDVRQAGFLPFVYIHKTDPQTIRIIEAVGRMW